MITILHPKGVLPAHNLLRVEALFQLLAPLRDDPHDGWRVQSQIRRVYLVAVKQLFRLLDLLPDQRASVISHLVSILLFLTLALVQFFIVGLLLDFFCIYKITPVLLLEIVSVHS